MKTKRTFKSIIAFALALILSLGVVSTAFAANSSITWTVDGETVSCTYHSDLEVGMNTVKIEESDYYYFDISELENGYYSAKLTNEVFEYFITPEKSGNKYVGWGKMELIDGIEYIIFNRRENVDVIVAGAYGATDEMTIEIEYLGENIESLEVEDKELLLHYDITEYDSSFWGFLDTTVTFTGGKTLEAEDIGYRLETENGLKSGENTVTIEFADYKSEQVLRIAEISDYIKRIKIDAPEDATAYIYYNYTVDEGLYAVDEITVVFTDDTEQVLRTDAPLDVTLPNGREINLQYGKGVDLEKRNACIYFSAGNCQVAVYYMNTEKASLEDNLEELRSQISWNFVFLDYYLDIIFRNFSDGDLINKISDIDRAVRAIGDCFEETAYEIYRFIDFMIK